MVLCSTCTVETVDRQCLNDSLCFGCCTTKSIRTCSSCFRRMGVSAQQQRRAEGLAPLEPPEPLQSQHRQGARPPSPPAEEKAPVIGGASGPPQQPPAADLSAIFSLLQQQAAALATLTARLDAVQSQAPPPLVPPPPPAPAGPSSSAPPPILAAAAAASAPPAPLSSQPQNTNPSASPTHRQGALGATATSDSALRALIQDVVEPRAADDDEDPGSPEVSSPSHPRATISLLNPLPASMIPTTYGSERDNIQVLVELISQLHRKTEKFPNFAALSRGLEEWWELAVRNNWTAQQLDALARYRNLLLAEWGPAHFSKAAEYHRLFTKAVSTGTHDMFAPSGHLNLNALHRSGLMSVVPSSATSSSSSPAGRKSKPHAPKTANKTGSTGKHPAGSCVHHPQSTSHTTAECRAAAAPTSP